MGRVLSQRMFQITPEITISAQSERTSYGFRHVATVFKNGSEVGFAKASYYNRTWEAFEFQSVSKSAISKSSLSPKEKEYAKRWLDGDRTDWTSFNRTYGIAMMGELIGADQKQKNVLKAKALQVGLGNQGLSFPDNWSSLPEATKTKRLNAVMGILKTKGKKDTVNDIIKKDRKMMGL